MQCPTCNVVYSNGLDNCPRCKTPAPQISVSEEIQYTETVRAENNGAAVETENIRMTDKQPETKSQSSTLIEFPGKKRHEMPAWRKELLEKFKEIQDKRAREAEEEEAKAVSEEIAPEIIAPTEEPAKPHLEVVQPAPVNPIVAKALERIERANNKPLNGSTNPNPKTNHRAAVVNGNLPLEQEEKEQKLSLIQPQQKVKAMGMSAAASGATQIHSHTNGVAAAKTRTTTKQLPDEDNYNISRNGTASIAQAVTDISSIPATQSFSNGQISKASSAAGIETIKTEKMPEAVKEVSIQKPEILETFSDSQAESTNESFSEDEDLQYDDYAPYMPRVVSVVFDMLAIIFAASPFAAVMELSDVDWTNDKIVISLGAILLLVAFFYLMASVAILGRTWGMATLSLRVADAETGESPSVGQSTGRALLFLLSVAAGFLPFLYTLFDAEGRALHDRISGTILVREE